MPTFKIRALTRFTDAETGKQIERWDIVETSSRERMISITSKGLGELVEARHDKTGGRVLIHQAYVGLVTGGINTANRHIAKAFTDYNLGFIVDKRDMATAIDLAKYCDVYIDDNKRRYECDVFILSNYNADNLILPRVKARKIYTMVHAVFSSLFNNGVFNRFKWQPNARNDKVLAVSETAQKGLETAFGVESVVVPNVLTPLNTERKVFIILSRAGKEKGIDKVIELYDRFAAAGKDFCFFICSESVDADVKADIEKRDRIVLIKPTAYNQELIKGADYLIQLSRGEESYCYSIREALQRQVPVIVSDRVEFNKIVQDGKNGFILKDDFSNLDIDKIFNSKLKFKPYAEPIPDIWHKVLRGEL